MEYIEHCYKASGLEPGATEAAIKEAYHESHNGLETG